MEDVFSSIFHLKQQVDHESLQDHEVKDDYEERMANILQTKDTIDVNGNSKKWFTNQHLEKLKNLKPFQDQVKDGMLRDILRRQDSQSSLRGLFSNLLKISFPESNTTNIPRPLEFTSNPVIHEVLLFVYQKYLLAPAAIDKSGYS